MARRTPSRALVLCNGEPPSAKLLRRFTAHCSYVVAADGGANTARRHGVRPDLIIGDLDSVSKHTRRAFGDVPLIRVTRQDNTDLEKALDLLVTRRVREVFILGATGRRLDFTLGNLSVLWRYVPRMSITVAGDGWYAVPVRRRTVVAAPSGTVASIVPNGVVHGVTLRGFRYPLRNASLAVGEIGVSNVVTSSPAAIAVRRGHLLVIVQRAWTRPRPRRR